MDLKAVDLADPGLYADGDPHLLWRELRRREPVRWQPVNVPDRPRARGFWAVTRYADVDRVLSDFRCFTSERGTLLNLLGRDDPARGRQLAATDPPRHDAMRLPLQRAMNAKSVAAHEVRIRSEVAALLAPGLGGAEFDFAVTMGMLPLAVIGPLFGLPAADWPDLARLAAMCAAEDDPDHQLPEGVAATLARGHRDLFAYFTGVVRRRMRDPGDDLISLMLTSSVDGERPGAGAVVSNCYSLLLGASVTLPHVPTAALYELARDGRGYADWAARPDLLYTGVEEALRWASPASHFMRHARCPVELSGVTIAEGDPVVAWLGSANRDAAMFTDPDRFDIRRSPNRHLAFGAGRHYCIGAQIARLTLRALFAELFAAFESVTVLADPVRVRSTFLAGIKRLPVIGQPRRRRSP